MESSRAENNNVMVFSRAENRVVESLRAPNIDVMEQNNRPSIDSLASNQKMRRAAYSAETSEIKDELITSFNNNFPVNVFPAKNMLTFHRVTLFLSYTLWFWVGLFLYIFYRHKKSKK
jgi:hypothetical protein